MAKPIQTMCEVLTELHKVKKVLFFLPGTIGGAERMAVTIGKILDTAKYQVKFVIVSGREDNPITSFIPEQYEVEILPIKKMYHFAVIRMAMFLRNEEPYAVYGSQMYLNSRLIFATKLAGLNTTRIVVRTENALSYTNSLNRLLVKLSYPFADRIIAQQDEMLREILDNVQVSESQVVVLQNPVDVDTIRQKIEAASPYVNDDEVRFIWVARFNPMKGQDLLVKAFKDVLVSVPDAHLYLVGKYSEDDFFCNIKSYVECNGISDRVHFVGYDSNPYRWVKGADCFVMPSRLEGLPNALIEAMYIGKPVVATTCIPVVSRIVENGYNGYLVDPEDPAKMAVAMIKALQLKDYSMTYKSATAEDFRQLFEDHKIIGGG